MKYINSYLDFINEELVDIIKKFRNFNESVLTDTFWEGDIDGGQVRVTLKDVLRYLDGGFEIDPNEIKSLLIDVERDPKRVERSDLKYPVILTSKGGEINSILDGQHRVVKALESGEMIKVRILDLDTAPDQFRKILD